MLSTLHSSHLQVKPFQVVIHQQTDILDQRIVIQWAREQIVIQRISMEDIHRCTTIGFQGIATDQQISIQIVNPTSILEYLPCVTLHPTQDILQTQDTPQLRTRAIQRIRDILLTLGIQLIIDILRIRVTPQTLDIPLIHDIHRPLPTQGIRQCDQKLATL